MTGTTSSSAMAERFLGWWLLVGGAVGLLAAGVLLVERFRLAEDSGYVPSCSVNPVLSCGSVMESPQASVFGFPNPIIGVAAFPLLLATGAALLAGACVARWFWLGLQVGVVAGVGFVAWLIAQSLYGIGALCPYCMVVWAVVIPTFWAVTARNLAAGVLGMGAARRWGSLVVAWQVPAIVATYLVVLALVGQRFWSYWSTLLGG